MTIRNDNGSVTLEAALILPFSLWLILLLTAWQYLSATEILLMNSMELLADEISLASSTFTSAEAAWDQLELYQLQGQEQELLDIGLELISEELLSSRLYYYYHALRQTAAFPQDYLVSLELDLDKSQEDTHSVWWISLNYKLDAVVGSVSRHRRWPVGIWKPAARSPAEEEAEQEAADESIWAADNFTRGKYFRDKYQANLPEFYPVIARYEAGTVTAIKSLDLNRATYQSSLALESQLAYMLQTLSDFSGSDQPTGLSGKPSIGEADIRQKKLLLIVPENHAAWQSAPLQRFSNQAAAAGVIVIIKKDGQSKTVDETTN